jgi:hypothetical protein
LGILAVGELPAQGSTLFGAGPGTDSVHGSRCFELSFGRRSFPVISESLQHQIHQRALLVTMKKEEEEEFQSKLNLLSVLKVCRNNTYDYQW